MSVAWAKGPGNGNGEGASLETNDVIGAAWVCTDGTGTSASSTVGLVNTRPEHGLLVASFPLLAERYVFLSTIQLTVVTENRNFLLLPVPAAPSSGASQLARFTRDPLPCWVFRYPDWELEFALGLVPGRRALVMRGDWRGAEQATLEVCPLLAMRPVSATMREHGGAAHRVRMRREEVSAQPDPRLPAIVFRCSGRFVGSPGWRCCDAEDLWTPGTFRSSLKPGESAFLCCGVEALPHATSFELWCNALEGTIGSHPGVASVRPHAVDRAAPGRGASLCDANRRR